MFIVVQIQSKDIEFVCLLKVEKKFIQRKEAVKHWCTNL